jgi:hypothetical protein
MKMQTMQQAVPNQGPNINKQARGQLGGLSAIFLLGMAVNLIGLPSETAGGTKTITTILLALHVLIGFGLIAGGISMVLRTKESALLKQAQVGLAAIILTFICGVIDVKTKSDWWSYAMSVGFMASLWAYIMLFVKTWTNK